MLLTTVSPNGTLGFIHTRCGKPRKAEENDLVYRRINPLQTDMFFWLVVSTYPSEKYDFVSWDDFSIPNIWKVIQNV